MDEYIRHNRKSIRLKEYDYSRGGYYFVTILTHNRKFLFGQFVKGEMVFSEAGKVALNCLVEIPEHFKNAQLDYYCVMPNHIHLILIIEEEYTVGTRMRVPYNLR